MPQFDDFETKRLSVETTTVDLTKTTVGTVGWREVIYV